jgi:hypothetical protein
VGDHDGALALGVAGADARELGAEGGVMALDIVVLQELAHHGGLGVGERIEVDGAVFVSEADAARRGGRHTEEVEPLGREELCAEAEAVGAVMVAGDQNHGDLEPTNQAGEDVVQKADGVRRRDGAVVDIAGDDDGIGARVADEVDELIEDIGLVLGQVLGMEEAAKVPVGGVDEAQGLSW